MITQERYGVRADGNPVTEITMYQEVAADHPMAITLPGLEGHYVKAMVGNSLTAIGAREVTRQQFLDAGEEIRLRGEAVMDELQRKHDLRQRELEEKKSEVRRELAKLGISPDTVNAILRQVREGV